MNGLKGSHQINKTMRTKTEIYNQVRTEIDGVIEGLFKSAQDQNNATGDMSAALDEELSQTIDRLHSIITRQVEAARRPSIKDFQVVAMESPDGDCKDIYGPNAFDEYKAFKLKGLDTEIYFVQYSRQGAFHCIISNGDHLTHDLVDLISWIVLHRFF